MIGMGMFIGECRNILQHLLFKQFTKEGSTVIQVWPCHLFLEGLEPGCVVFTFRVPLKLEGI